MFGDCFDCVFVINLDERPDKWAGMVARLAEAGMENVERVPAIKRVLADLPPNMYSGMNLKRVPYANVNGYPSGSCGCKLSHARAIQLARDRRYKRVLILEDDAHLVGNALPRFARAWRALEGRPWDMLYLGGRHRSRRKAQYYSRNLIRVFCTYQTHAYAFDQSMYDVWLEEIRHSDNEIDVLYADCVQPFYKCFAVFPNIFEQKQELIDITGVFAKLHKQRRAWYLLPVLGPIYLKWKRLCEKIENSRLDRQRGKHDRR
jgi:glycosyl transferase family 25